MDEDLLQKLRLYEEDYASQPRVVQKSELPVINQLRAQLGMPPVDENLREIAPAMPEAAAPSPKEPEPPREDTNAEARQIYLAYLEKLEELERHRAYAMRIAEATAGEGQTPVRPLATMGTGGGPLLCDHCGKAIVLEGGAFHGQTADVAWRARPNEDWTSWILGGLVVEITTNGTLRIYHGYMGGNADQCCNAARRKEERAVAEFKSPKKRAAYDKLLAFLAQERADMSPERRSELLYDIMNTMFEYDPGIGLNRP